MFLFTVPNWLVQFSLRKFSVKIQFYTCIYKKRKLSRNLIDVIRNLICTAKFRQQTDVKFARAISGQTYNFRRSFHFSQLWTTRLYLFYWRVEILDILLSFKHLSSKVALQGVWLLWRSRFRLKLYNFSLAQLW